MLLNIPTFNIPITRGVLSFSSKSNETSKQDFCIEFDCFSKLDKFEKEYKCSLKKNIIPDLKQYLANSQLLTETDIKGILGEGGLSLVFDLGDKGVLKGSLENPLEYREYNKDIDVPFLSPVVRVNNTYFVQQKKADTKNVTTSDCKKVIKNIIKAGYETSVDFDEYKVHQIGKINGKPYLLDTRCAVPPPNYWSRFIYNLYRDYNQVFVLKDMSHKSIIENDAKMLALFEKYGPKVYHVVESPRRNISLKEGLKVFIKLLKQEYVKLDPWENIYTLSEKTDK